MEPITSDQGNRNKTLFSWAKQPKTFDSIVTAVIAQSDAGFQWI